jgi:t-SNARE syntaxin family protein
MEMMHEQDEALDGVFQTVGNLRMQADTMGRELEEQADMLDDVDNITERVQGKLATGMKKINFVIRQNEGECAVFDRSEGHITNGDDLDTWSSCCIGVMIFVLIILLVLLIIL